MNNEISLKDCAVISLEEYTRLKEIEASKNNIISSTLQFLIEKLISEKATKIKYKGLTLTRNEMDFSFSLHIPSEALNNE